MLDSVMDSAKTTRDEGTFWAPEDRAWLWYNDTHRDPRLGAAHADRARARRSAPRRAGAVAVPQQEAQPLEVDARHRRGRSTRWRTTSRATKPLGVREEVDGRRSARRTTDFRLRARPLHRQEEPDRRAGRRSSTPSATRRRSIESRRRRRGFAFASATWHFSTEQLPAEARGDLFARRAPLLPAREERRGDDARAARRGRTARGRRRARGAALDPRQGGGRVRPPARPARRPGSSPRAPSRAGAGISGSRCYEEMRDSGTNFFFEELPAGEYTLQVPPARQPRRRRSAAAPAELQSMYAPEFVAYSAGAKL